ncbi:hypothetical protein ACWGKQ_21675 [Streptomyces sp. NPDC054770]
MAMTPLVGAAEVKRLDAVVTSMRAQTAPMPVDRKGSYFLAGSVKPWSKFQPWSADVSSLMLPDCASWNLNIS